jgi:hypothetical protein
MQKHQIQQALITGAIWALILSVESKSALFAYQTQATPIEGFQFAAITLLGAILAAMGFTLVGQRKADPRKPGAFVIRLLAIAFLMFPVFFFGSAVKLHNAQTTWDAYHASPAYAVDVAIANQATLPLSEQTRADYEIDEAAERTVRPTNANLSIIDAEFWFSLILLLVLNLAAEHFQVKDPITKEELDYIRRSEAAKKGAETRERNRQRREAAKRRREQEAQPQQPKRRLFGLIAGGKA